MKITGEETEEQQIELRRLNILEQAKDHQRGAERLPTGIPESCHVEQPRAQMEHILPPTYRQGDAQYTNGELRIQYINGKNRTEYKMGFAGRARTQGEMNSGEGVNDIGLHLT